jgi:60 kDa SS-A/Ro ribonucleoprotein
VLSVTSNQGGAVYKVTDFARVRRLIFCGNEGASTYYTRPSHLRRDQATAVTRLLESGQGHALLAELEEISVSGRAAKQSNLLFVLAMCARFGTEEVRQKAYRLTATICRIPTALFEFLDLAKQLHRPAAAETIKIKKGGKKGKKGGKGAKALPLSLRPVERVEKVERVDPPVKPVKTRLVSPHMQGGGWGALPRREIAAWYNGKTPADLAYQATKYRNRGGWSHRDVFRLVHPKPATPSHAGIFEYLCKGADAIEKIPDSETRLFLMAVEKAKTADEKETCHLIKTYRLAREHLSTTMLKSVPVWEALFVNMPMTAFLRNLGLMTGLGLFAKPALVAEAVRRLHDEAGIKKARLHPFHILVALMTYKTGRSPQGGSSWTPVPAITTALDEAFYLAFKCVQPTGKRFVVAADVSGSMDGAQVNGSPGITARMAATAMLMLWLRTERDCIPLAFTDKLVPLPVTKTMALADALNVCNRLPFGGTYCDVPITWALENDIPVDVFVILTDCENGRLKRTPADALRDYRVKMGIPDAKLIVMAFSSAGFTIADPEDPNMLDMTGFDSAGPEIAASFIQGRL